MEENSLTTLKDIAGDPAVHGHVPTQSISAVPAKQLVLLARIRFGSLTHHLHFTAGGGGGHSARDCRLINNRTMAAKLLGTRKDFKTTFQRKGRIGTPLTSLEG